MIVATKRSVPPLYIPCPRYRARWLNGVLDSPGGKYGWSTTACSVRAVDVTSSGRRTTALGSASRHTTTRRPRQPKRATTGVTANNARGWHATAIPSSQPARARPPAPRRSTAKAAHSTNARREAVLGMTPERSGADHAESRHDAEREPLGVGVVPVPGDRIEREQDTACHDRRHGDQDQPERLVSVALGERRSEPEAMPHHHHGCQQVLESRRRIEL